MKQKLKKTEVWHIICLTTPPQVSSLGSYALRIAFNLQEQGKEVHLWSLSKEAGLNGVHCHFLKDKAGQKGFIKNFEALLNKNSVIRVLWFYEPRIYRVLNKKLPELLSKRNREKTSLSVIIHKGLEKSYNLPHLRNFFPYFRNFNS